MINYRQADLRDKAALQNLWEEAFPQDKGDFSTWYFKKLFDINTTYVAESDNGIAGSLYAPIITLSVKNKPVRVPFVQGVATQNKQRKQGIAKNLIAFSMDDLQRKGYPFAVLVPFFEHFYERLGWQTYAKAHPFNLTNFCVKSCNNIAALYTIQTPKNHDDLTKIYDQFGSSFYSYPLRDETRWQNILHDHKTDGGLIYMTDSAYLLFFIENDKLKIRELAYTSKEAAEDLLNKTIQKLQLPHLEYTKQPNAMYYDLHNKGTQRSAFPIDNSYFNELF